MAYDYASEKLSVYLSDDGGSILTFYALHEASEFARKWIPYCRKFRVEPRSPAAYFRCVNSQQKSCQINEEFEVIKRLYEEMAERIETATNLGRIPEELHSKHRGFSQWGHSYSSTKDHDAILQILIDGKDSNATDIDGRALPTLVYLAREKRPHYPHHFKAGAMNALIRISSKISNGEIILNVDCDMYSNNSLSVLDALCFFMDDKKGHEVAFVQFPQCFENVTKNDLYGSSHKAIYNVELHGIDGAGGPLYCGTGCFHRRDVLCGKKFTEDCKFEWKKNHDPDTRQSIQDLEEEAKPLASCTYEQNTEWGIEMGLLYGCPVEDVITGLAIQCRGWKSVYLNPEREAFLGLAPTTLFQILVQQKRWSEGDFQILLSKYSPAWYANGKISFGLQLGYCCYCFWAPSSFATLYYVVFPSLCLLKGIPLFPQVSSLWFLPFVYAVSAKYIYSLAEFLWCGGTLLGWWNEQRMWIYKRTTSYLFGFIDIILKLSGLTDSSFLITAKVASEDMSERYEKELMEFGLASPMFTILATIAMINMFCFSGILREVILNRSVDKILGTMVLQVLICGGLVVTNKPLYEGLFVRNDKGKLPSSVAYKSVALALFACVCFTLLF